MIRRPPRSTRPDTSFPTRRSSDLDMRARLGLGNDPHAPRDNILAGTYYLRLMYDCFGYPGLFGAYNAGPARYAAFVRTGRALPAERSEEHTSELQSLMRISYAVFCLKKKTPSN